MFNKEMYELGSNRSSIRELFEFGQNLKNKIGAENVYDFSLGNPTVPTPACVKEAIDDILLNDKTAHNYTSAQGDVRTRTALCNYVNETHCVDFNPDNFYMTCGAAASLMISIKSLITKSDDEIIIIAPFFPEYTVFTKTCGGKPVVIPADREKFQIDFKKLENVINENTKAVIINSPNNPSGVVYTEETIVKLSELLNRKNNELDKQIFIICDEPYREIVYNDIFVPYVPKYYDNTIVCYSYSKSLSLAGERIGYIIVPDKAYDSKNLYLTVLGSGRSLGYVCAPSLFQKVITKCLGQTGDINIYKENRDILFENLTKIGYECINPEGAFYLMLKTIGPSKDFAQKAKEFNLLLVDGADFGLDGYVRISYCVDKSQVVNSIEAFEKLYLSFK